MSLEQTLTLIKPDATKRNLIGRIISEIEQQGFKICDMKMLTLDRNQAKAFYAEHQGKAFFQSLIDYMTSGAIVAIVLQKENAIADYRMLIGSTNIDEQGDNSLRKKFAISQQENSLHGSDSQASAVREIDFFFGK